MSTILPKTALLLLLSLLPRALAGNMIAHNQCAFDVWCSAAKNDGTFSPSVPVSPGQSYLSPKPANTDNIGVVVKCGMDARLLQPWQVEMNVDLSGTTWLDLSAIDGSPFAAYHRRVEIPGTACAVNCPAGASQCEWPYMVNCQSTGDLSIFLC
ncbi:hypothetical protein GGS21DRAFT_489375 [Xylaria nigripes]|nr:hypothetical protein GGS21DRAFT_489375 [Xylaria nigripes]